MAYKKVKLLRPLDGDKEGDTVVFTAADAKRLEGRGAVEILGDASAPKSEAMAPENKDLTRAPANKANAFDHDGDGSPGGSLAGAQSTRARGAAKRKA
jgi:hypothetical protein